MPTWIDSDLQEQEITWLHVEGTATVSNAKELLRVRVAAVTDGYPCQVAFDNIQLYKNLILEKATGNNISYLPLDAMTGPAEIPVFGAVGDGIIAGAHLVPKETITGNNTNYTELKLNNKASGAVIATLTFTAGHNAPAYAVTDFGPADPNAGLILAGGGVSLRKVDYGTGMALPQMVLALEWNLR